MSKEALKLALEALEFDGFTPEDATHRIFTINAITAVREALAQPEQQKSGMLHIEKLDKWLDASLKEREEAAQPALDAAFLRQVLSVAIAGLYEHYKDDVLAVFDMKTLAEVVEYSEPLRTQRVEGIYKQAWDMLNATPQLLEESAAVKTLKHLRYTYNQGAELWKPPITTPKAQPEQEPVAFEEWLAKQHGDPEEIGLLQALRIAYIAGQDSITPPPQRTWVGLTAAEIHDTEGYKETRELYRFARAIEAKLKELNT